MLSRILRASCVVLLGWLTVSTAFAQSYRSSTSADSTIYDADPGHIANRIYRALYTWKGADEAAPMHWPQSKYSLEAAKLRPLLDELLQLDVSKEFADPVKRVFLQRDLWLAFDWLAQQPSIGGIDDPMMQRKLARCIRHVALPLARLRELPDNYSEEISSDAYSVEFDRSHPEAPFLPAGLWSRNGPWILVGDRDTRSALATEHTDFFRGHSAYLIFIRLPKGRVATLDYLSKVVVAARSHNELPHLPEGTQVALVGQVMAIDDQGQPFPTMLTETIQVRVYRQPKKSLTLADDAQARFEFRLDRSALFAHKPSLRPVSSKQLDWEFINYLGKNKSSSEPKGGVMASCADCHNEPGVESFKTFAQTSGTRHQVRRLTLSKRSEEVGRVITWKKHQADFQLLKEFWQQ